MKRTIPNKRQTRHNSLFEQNLREKQNQQKRERKEPIESSREIRIKTFQVKGLEPFTHET